MHAVLGLCENVTSSTKPEVHNILHCHQRRTEPLPRDMYRKLFLRYASEQRDIHTGTLIALLLIHFRCKTRKCRRFIQVIPELDMPGHAHAAIAAMKARYHATNDTTYLLSDLDDSSQYRSVTFAVLYRLFVRFLLLCDSVAGLYTIVICPSVRPYVHVSHPRPVLQNAAAHLMSRVRRHNHVTPILHTACFDC